MWDLRYAFRVLRKSPVFALTTIVTLALCVGANTAIYTVVDRLLLRPLPYPEPERLMMVVKHFERHGSSDDETGQTGAMWERLRDGVTTVDLAAVAGGFGGGVNLAVGRQVESVQQRRVSAGYFRLLGVPPSIGREFTAGEDRVHGPAAAILSHSLWARVFQSDPGIIGRSITLRGEPYTVVGVMPATLQSLEQVDLWTPARPCRMCEGGGDNYEFIARLRPGVSWAEADGQVASVAAPALDDQFRGRPFRVAAHLIPLQRGEMQEIRQPLLILWAAVGAVLLIGCVNIAGLLLARSVTRGPEIATRMAIGGGRRAIVRQLLIESLVLAACGGWAGVLIGYACVRVFSAQLTDALGMNPFGLDVRVLTTTGGLSLLTSVVFGLFPALQASRVDLRAAMIESGGTAVAGGSTRWSRRVMVLAEVALGVVLLVGAGLLIRSFEHLVNRPPGFDGRNVVAGTLSLQDARYTTSEHVNELFARSLERMRAIPGVESAAVSLTLPYERALNEGWRFVGGATPADVSVINVTYVTPDYFKTFRIPILRGRAFTDADTRSDAPFMIVNQAFVHRYTRDQDPIGRQIAIGTVRTVVGVAGDIVEKAGWGRYEPLDVVPAAYIPAAQTTDAFLQMVHTWFSPSWAVRLGRAQQGIIPAMQQAIQAVDPMLPFNKFRSMDDVRSETLSFQRALALLLGTMAGLAVLLAAVGIYGLVASSVGERTRELGIRVALGATPRETVRVAALPGIVLGAAGVAIGIALARLGSRVLEHLVWGVTVSDPLTFVVAASAVLAMALVATLVPSMRILRLDPVRSLRQT
jgi:predicted permease